MWFGDFGRNCPELENAGACFAQHLADLFAECGLEHNAALPHLFRDFRTGVTAETHMDDFYCTGPQEEALAFVMPMKQKLRSKATDVCYDGRFQHMKRNRLRLPDFAASALAVCLTTLQVYTAVAATAIVGMLWTRSK